MAEFDTISKHLIQTYPDDFAGFTLGREDVEVLAVIEGEHVLESGQSGLIPFTPLMKPPEGMASDAWLHQCIHTARTRRIDRSYRADYLAGMVTLSELVHASETISGIIFKKGIMDLIRESSLFQSLTQESRKEAREEALRRAERKALSKVKEEALSKRFSKC